MLERDTCGPTSNSMNKRTKISLWGKIAMRKARRLFDVVSGGSFPSGLAKSQD